MNPYTVVLIRPSDATGRDPYVAHVKADDPYHAVLVARLELQAADVRDGLRKSRVSAYYPLLVFADHQDPIIFGWMLKT